MLAQALFHFHVSAFPFHSPRRHSAGLHVPLGVPCMYILYTCVRRRGHGAAPSSSERAARDRAAEPRAPGASSAPSRRGGLRRQGYVGATKGRRATVVREKSFLDCKAEAGRPPFVAGRPRLAGAGAAVGSRPPRGSGSNSVSVWIVSVRRVLRADAARSLRLSSLSSRCPAPSPPSLSLSLSRSLYVVSGPLSGQHTRGISGCGLLLPP